MRPSKVAGHQPEGGKAPSRAAAADAVPHVTCVIVTYLPAHQPLLRQIEAIGPQVQDIILVDNGDGSTLPAFEHPGVDIILLGSNQGIASAQNIGIRRARERGADHILLLDQDSLPAADMVARLIEALATLHAEGMVVGAVGPQYRDDRQGIASPFIYRQGFSLKERAAAPQIPYVPTDFLIASGCLISMGVLDTVGDMDAALFIDYVDIEWGLRAKHRGYPSYGVPAAQMMHSLGDEWIVYRGRRFPVHSPQRHYYYVRNSILLARRPWIGWPWRSILIRRVAKQLVFFSVVVSGKRLENFQMMMLGILHGIIGRDGKL